jgi:putative phosphoribosyl transferase
MIGNVTRVFRDRTDAGARLAHELERFRVDDPVVLGLPRGGVPVAFEIACALDAPLDVVVVRKLGLPSQPELAMGAVGEGGTTVVNDRVVHYARVSPDALAAVANRERAEVERRARQFRGDRPALPLTGRTVIVVDDGIATGSTAHAALRVVRAQGAARVVLAVPVAPPETVAELRAVADEVVCLESPRPPSFFAVGQWYANFTQVTDDEVNALLARAGARSSAGPRAEPVPELVPEPLHEPVYEPDVELRVGSAVLTGDFVVPRGATGIVVFAHGSGSGRHSSRNRGVARAPNEDGLGTLLFDLLTPSESADRANVFDVELLGRRLAAVTEWVRRHDGAGPGPLGYFGASTGAAAALWAAAEPGNAVAAVVSRGGRPDLAGARLGAVRAPTLLIVGGRDEVVADLNRAAARELACEHRIEVVPGATHLFEEPGALETVATLAGDWFHRHFAASGVPRRKD